MTDRDPESTSELPRIEPTFTGSAGTQVASLPPSTESSVTLVPSSIDQRHLGAVLHDFSDVRTVAVSTIAVAAFNDAQEARRFLAERLDRCREEHRKEREQRIILETQGKERGRTSWVATALQTVGGLVAGVGLPPFLQEASLQTAILSALGLAAVGSGIWLSHSSGPK